MHQGFTFVGIPDVVARWIPRHERVRALTGATLGYTLGNAINFPLTGFIIHHLGWSKVFYIFGKLDVNELCEADGNSESSLFHCRRVDSHLVPNMDFIRE